MNVLLCGRSEWGHLNSPHRDRAVVGRQTMQLRWMRGTKLIIAALVLTFGATSIATAQGYGYYPRHHDWHYGAHHDWHSGFHYGRHNRFHWDRRYGWHYGEHYGLHSGTHHDWH